MIKKSLINIPPIRFSRWTKWDKKDSIPGIDYPGIYVLAIFKSRLPRKVDLFAKEIIYIGETCATKRNIKKRLCEFDNSAFHPKYGHSGGCTFRKLFKNQLDWAKDHLYISAMPAKLKRNINDLFIRFVERKLIFQYARTYGIRPRCNRK